MIYRGRLTAWPGEVVAADIEAVFSGIGAAGDSRGVSERLVDIRPGFQDRHRSRSGEVIGSQELLVAGRVSQNGSIEFAGIAIQSGRDVARSRPTSGSAGHDGIDRPF